MGRQGFETVYILVGLAQVIKYSFSDKVYSNY